MFDKTITIVNKLKKADIVGGTVDLWYKTVIHGVDFKKVLVKNVSGTTVSMGESHMVLIPFFKGYLPYSEWKLNPLAGFTASQGDYIFLGMELEEIPTAATITAIKNLYEPNVCDIRMVTVAQNNGIAKTQLKIDGG